MTITTQQERFDRIMLRINKTSNGCWEWLGSVTKQGYGKFGDYYGKTQLIHRFVFMHTNSCVLTDECVLHRCDNRRCCNPEHLFLGTRSLNSLDRHAKGRTKPSYKSSDKCQGEDCASAKLTWVEVYEIRKLWGEGIYQIELAERYGVHKGTINKIVHNRTWRGVHD